VHPHHKPIIALSYSLLYSLVINIVGDAVYLPSPAAPRATLLTLLH